METETHEMEVLSRSDAIELLRREEVGRLVYTRRALPAITVVNYAVRAGGILIWTGSLPSLAQAVRSAVVAFEVDHVECGDRCAWSVVVTAVAQLVTDESELARAHLDGPVPWAPGPKEHLIRIPLTVVTGRRTDGARHLIAAAGAYATARI